MTLAPQIDRRGIAELCPAHAIEILVLFGSQAAGRATAESDVDLGFLRWGERMTLREQQALAARLRPLLPAGELDLVDLARVPGLLKYLAAERGVVLYEARPGRFEAFRVRAWNQYQDERLAIRRYDREGIRIALARITALSPVDRDVVRRKLARILRGWPLRPASGTGSPTPTTRSIRPWSTRGSEPPSSCTPVTWRPSRASWNGSRQQ